MAPFAARAGCKRYFTPNERQFERCLVDAEKFLDMLRFENRSKFEELAFILRGRGRFLCGGSLVELIKIALVTLGCRQVSVHAGLWRLMESSNKIVTE
jgi:hypothetical protein